MKYFLFLLITMITLGACSKDKSAVATVETPASLQATFSNTPWRVINFVKAGNDRTNNFNGVRLLFYPDGHMTANNDLFSVNGTWGTRTDGAKKFLNINLDPQASFNDLNNDWEITVELAQSISMQAANGNDRLTLERILVR